jgi:nucleoside recognition membrane protein YjiH
MTSKQYEQGFYTQREAAVIGTTFSIVSITFSLVVIGTVGLESHFLPFFATVCLSGLVAAIIVPRLPPLRNKVDTFVNGEHRKQDDEMIPAGQTALQVGLQRARERAFTVPDPQTVIRSGAQNALDMVLGILPVVMAVGTAALIVAEHTPLFDYLGQPFVPLLKLMSVPEAEAASRTILVGFADMFLPAILAADIQSDMTRFIIAALSVSQLIYMSEVGALMLGSSIPVSLGELFVIFVLRTLVVLPVIVAMAHWLF